MNELRNGWFSEITSMFPGRGFSIQVEQILHSEKSKFQDILILKTFSHGIVMVLNGIIHCTELDEFSYHEMISFVPLFSHPNPQRVLIIGGGDGGVAREVAKHPSVQTIDLVETDDRVVELSRKFLPFLAVGLNSPKVNLYIADGYKFLEAHIGYYDVIITDSSDPIDVAHRFIEQRLRPVNIQQDLYRSSPVVSLFQESYFDLIKHSLRPGGIVCSQADTIWGHMRNVLSIHKYCKAVFPNAVYASTNVSTYPAGQIGLELGSLDENLDFSNPAYQFTDEQLKDMKLRYYTNDIHKAAFSLPAFVVEALNAENNSS